MIQILNIKLHVESNKQLDQIYGIIRLNERDLKQVFSPITKAGSKLNSGHVAEGYIQLSFRNLQERPLSLFGQHVQVLNCLPRALFFSSLNTRISTASN